MTTLSGGAPGAIGGPARTATAAPAVPGQPSRRLARAAAIADLERLARRRLPRFVFDYLAGGAGDESGLARDRETLQQALLVPRVLRDVSALDPSVEIFGRRYAQPFGVAPIGLGNLIWPGAEQHLVQMAAARGLPYVLSTPACSAIEACAGWAPGHPWFQLYPSTEERVTLGLMERARAVGVEVLVVTLDVPHPGRRRRDIRNGFTLPFRMDAATLWDLATHPRWSLATWRAGVPGFANLAPYAEPGAGGQSLAAFMARQISGRVDPAALRRIRAHWPGALVVKGVLHPDDAALAVESGADGVIVSSHGGRQLGSAPAAFAALPAVADRVGGRAVVMMDSGLRSGEDVLKALDRGAACVLMGRSFMFGVAAGGAAGADRAAEILTQELRAAMAMTGRVRVRD